MIFIIILYSSCTFNYIRLLHLRLLYFLHHFIFIANISVKLRQRYEFISFSILYDSVSEILRIRMLTHTAVSFVGEDSSYARARAHAHAQEFVSL